jgi:hypothetical protein
VRRRAGRLINENGAVKRGEILHEINKIKEQQFPCLGRRAGNCRDCE